MPCGTSGPTTSTSVPRSRRRRAVASSMTSPPPTSPLFAASTTAVMQGLPTRGVDLGDRRGHRGPVGPACRERGSARRVEALFCHEAGHRRVVVVRDEGPSREDLGVAADRRRDGPEPVHERVEERVGAVLPDRQLHEHVGVGEQRCRVDVPDEGRGRAQPEVGGEVTQRHLLGAATRRGSAVPRGARRGAGRRTAGGGRCASPGRAARSSRRAVPVRERGVRAGGRRRCG